MSHSNSPTSSYFSPLAVTLLAVMFTIMALGNGLVALLAVIKGEDAVWASVMGGSTLYAAVGVWRLAVRSQKIGYVPPLSSNERWACATLFCGLFASLVIGIGTARHDTVTTRNVLLLVIWFWLALRTRFRPWLSRGRR